MRAALQGTGKSYELLFFMRTFVFFHVNYIVISFDAKRSEAVSSGRPWRASAHASHTAD